MTHGYSGKGYQLLEMKRTTFEFNRKKKRTLFFLSLHRLNTQSCNQLVTVGVSTGGARAAS